MEEQILELYNAGWAPDRIAAQMQIHSKTVRDAIAGKPVKKKDAVAAVTKKKKK